MSSFFNVARRWIPDVQAPATIVNQPWHVEFRKFQDGGRTYTGFIIEKMRFAKGAMTFNNFPKMLTVLIHK